MDAHTPNQTSLAKTPLNLFKEIYKVERELRVRLRKKRISPDQSACLRRKRTKVYWKTFREWLKDTAPLVPPGTALGKAVHYARNHYTRVIRYLKYPEVTPDNNIAENAIRISGVPHKGRTAGRSPRNDPDKGEARGTLATPFVVGRKNWLFCSTPRGAYAGAYGEPTDPRQYA